MVENFDFIGTLSFKLFEDIFFKTGPNVVIKTKLLQQKKKKIRIQSVGKQKNSGGKDEFRGGG